MQAAYGVRYRYCGKNCNLSQFSINILKVLCLWSARFSKHHKTQKNKWCAKDCKAYKSFFWYLKNGLFFKCISVMDTNSNVIRFSQIELWNCLELTLYMINFLIDKKNAFFKPFIAYVHKKGFGFQLVYVSFICLTFIDSVL